MKVGVLLYHSNIFKLYKKEWIDKCLDSIRRQTAQNFHVYELCYSEEAEKLWLGWRGKYSYYHAPMLNHIFAMNHLLDKAFKDCDVVLNVNLDDHYHPQRFEWQLLEIERGYDLVSGNFRYIEEIDGEDRETIDMIFHDVDIGYEQRSGHNVLCHSAIAYTKKFWEENKYYNVNSIGSEDLELWVKAVANNVKIKIIPEILCYYRLSPNQTGRLNSPKGLK